MKDLRALLFAFVAILAFTVGCSTSEEASVGVGDTEGSMGVSAAVDTEARAEGGEFQETAYSSDLNERRIGGECHGRLDQSAMPSRSSGFSARAGGEVETETYSQEDLSSEDRFSSLPSSESNRLEGEAEVELEGEAELEGGIEGSIEEETEMPAELEGDRFVELPPEDEGKRTIEVASDRLVPAPPEGFVRASEVADLPENIPGLGRLYVAKETAPTGPWLGYDEDGTLVNVVIMVPNSALDEMKDPADLVDLQPGILTGRIDHVDILPAEGHPGLEEAHFNVVLWFIPHDQEKDRIGEAHH